MTDKKPALPLFAPPAARPVVVRTNIRAGLQEKYRKEP